MAGYFRRLLTRDDCDGTLDTRTLVGTANPRGTEQWCALSVRACVYGLKSASACSTGRRIASPGIPFCRPREKRSISSTVFAIGHIAKACMDVFFRELGIVRYDCSRDMPVASHPSTSATASRIRGQLGFRAGQMEKIFRPLPGIRLGPDNLA
jgi:hypothetical protein